jgi:hypothetical protein
MLVELRLEALEQRERVGGAAGEAGEDAVLVQAPHLLGAAFDDDVAERDLAIAAERHRALPTDGKDGGAVQLFHGDRERRKQAEGPLSGPS